MPEMTDACQWQARTMGGSDGKITEIWEDPQTGNPEWATVASGRFGTKSNFVPLAGASPDGEDVRAQVTKAQVRDAPGVEADGELSEAENAGCLSTTGSRIRPGVQQRLRVPQPATRPPMVAAEGWFVIPAVVRVIPR